MRVGASGRGIDNSLKESYLDFALWKHSDDEHSYKTSCRCGVPGWHIECSVMATSLLGDTIDIHGGGEDLKFPHHTNEIAQSEAKTGKTFANYWMHNAFVMVGDDKMSKSLNNFITLNQALEEYNHNSIRYLLASSHYRKPIKFNKEVMQQVDILVRKIENAYNNLKNKELIDKDDDVKMFKTLFIKNMLDDFNVENAISVFFEFLKHINLGNYSKDALKFFEDVLEILGLSFTSNKIEIPEEIKYLLEKRKIARENKDYKLSDTLRDKLFELGYLVIDGKNSQSIFTQDEKDMV